MSQDGCQSHHAVFLRGSEFLHPYQSLNLTDTDLQEYVKSDRFSLRFYTKTDEILLSDHQIRWQATFFVDAEIFGI